MAEKYLIFNRTYPLAPLSQMDKQYNSRHWELNKDEAIKFVKEENEKLGEELFYFLSVPEYKLSVRERLLDAKFSNERDEKIQNILNKSPEYSKLCNMIDVDYAKLDNNINGFSLPIAVQNNEEYKKKLQEILEKFISYINKPAFESEKNLIEDVKLICKKIIESLDLAISGQNDKSEAVLAELLKSYINHEFGVSELDKSYAFRGLAPFKELHSVTGKEYDLMMSSNLSFFRGRTVNKKKNEEVNNLKDICSLSYSEREKANDLRFSSKGEICLYLGTTTYVCSQECRWIKESQDLYMAAFKFNEKGKKLKILNLVISQFLINGIYNNGLDKENEYKRHLQITMIKLLPLIIATSFTVKTSDEIRKNDYGESIKFEYLLTQRLIKSIQNADIDGIAYLSKQGENDLQYPHGVNLAIPMNDVSENKEYSSLYKCFEITLPILFDENKINKELIGNEVSYINKHYPEYLNSHSYPWLMSKVYYQGKNIFYGKTPFSKLDNYLINQNFEEFKI